MLLAKSCAAEEENGTQSDDRPKWMTCVNCRPNGKDSMQAVLHENDGQLENPKQ